MGYVTPPALDIGIFSNAIIGLMNQNVSFNYLSPIGTALEAVSINWLCEIVGWQSGGGVLTSGGSEANRTGLTLARLNALGPDALRHGNYSDQARLRVYCSDQTHHSIEKAAIDLGLGASSVVRVPTGVDHGIDLLQLEARIARDQSSPGFLPMAIVGNAGTRVSCAFDDLAALRQIADRHTLWLHVDAAYGGFLRLASAPPPETEMLRLADSVTLDPHKLLFVPFDCGSVLVRRQSVLEGAYGAEGEYRTGEFPTVGPDFANSGIQLGRSMKGLGVYMAAKYMGVEGLRREYDRLLGMAELLRDRVLDDEAFDLVGPSNYLAVCFRWKGTPGLPLHDVNAVNSRLRRKLLSSGVAFLDEVELDGITALRACMVNFRCGPAEVDQLMDTLLSILDTRPGDVHGTPGEE